MPSQWTLKWKLQSWIPTFRSVGVGQHLIGRAPECPIRINHPSVSAHHAWLIVTESGCDLNDLGSSNGTRHKGGEVQYARLAEMDTFIVGDVEISIGPKKSLAQIYREQKHSVISILIHAAIILLLARYTLFPVAQQVSDFEASAVSSSSFLEDSAPKGEPPGGEAAAGPEMPDPAAPDMSATIPEASLSMITTTAPSQLSFSAPVIAMPSTKDLKPSAGAKPGGGGGSSFRSAGFGKGSGFGKGVGGWVGGGSGGLGISGRGKTLKTVNEFSVYFVIHSGDWYAALDTRSAPAGRQKEESPEGLPDSKNIKWGNMTPIPKLGPFVNSFWGGDWRIKGIDEMGGLVGFTPGAMANLLRFVRQASADNIKGAAKPSAVVLDKSLVPYTYNKTTKLTQWNPEGRENLREAMRGGLPVLDDYFGGSHGYIWNPKPEDKTHTDFTVEYLLDVRPMPPFVYFTGNDDFTLSDAEVETLYKYILSGGAIWGDCGFAGENSKFEVAFKREMKRVIPDEDKAFRPLKKENDLFIAGPDAYFDKENDFNRLPYGMQYYDAPIEVIEMKIPGSVSADTVVSVVLTRNAYGNFLRFETTVVNNRFSIGGQLGRGFWASTMWNFREEFFRGLGEGAIIDSYKLGTNILVYMLGRWPTILSRPENRHLLQ